MLASFVLAGAFLARNLRTRSVGLRAGLVLVAVGWALNMAVVAANGGMPVSADALAVSALPGNVDVAQGHLWKHVDIDGGTRLSVLGDVLAVGFVPAVFSVGDLSMTAGIVLTVAAATKRRDERRPTPVPAW